jgi:hypothetical protein
MNDETIEFEYPDDYEDEAWIWEAKGFIYVNARTSSGDEYTIFLIEPGRLRQEISRVSADCPYFESNLVIVPATTRENIELAIRSVIRDHEQRLARKPLSSA